MREKIFLPLKNPQLLPCDTSREKMPPPHPTLTDQPRGKEINSTKAVAAEMCPEIYIYFVDFFSVEKNGRPTAFATIFPPGLRNFP